MLSHRHRVCRDWLSTHDITSMRALRPPHAETTRTVQLPWKTVTNNKPCPNSKLTRAHPLCVCDCACGMAWARVLNTCNTPVLGRMRMHHNGRGSVLRARPHPCAATSHSGCTASRNDVHHSEVRSALVRVGSGTHTGGASVNASGGCSG